MPRPWPLAMTGSRSSSAAVRAACSAPPIHTSEPSTRTGRWAAAISRAMAAAASGSPGAAGSQPGSGGRRPGRAARTVCRPARSCRPPGSRGAGPKRASRAMSTKTGPRCGAVASRNASSTPAPIFAVSCSVQAALVMGRSSSGWSNSCRLPEPQRPSGARPPRITTGEPLNWAVVMALTPLVTPGPAVSTARPGSRVSRAVASAANTAVCSCRTSSSRIGGSMCTAASYSGNTCPPDSVNMVSAPLARAAAAASVPPCAVLPPSAPVRASVMR